MANRWRSDSKPTRLDPPASRLPRGWTAEQTRDLQRRLEWRARLLQLHLMAVRQADDGDLEEFDTMLDGLMGLREALGVGH